MVQLGYTAERDSSGVLTIRSVPIFVECTRDDIVFDKQWISAAVLKAKQAEADGYLPPLHVRHHESGPGENVRAAGFFRITGTRPIRFKGEERVAILADLVITDPMVGQEILQKRLPYRSVEIFDVDKPSIDSLALLDHEAPYLELPMLMVSQLTDKASGAADPSVVASATFANPWRKQASPERSGLVACFRRGKSAHLFYEDTMSKQNFEADEKKEEKMADEEKDNGKKMADDEKDGEKMAEGGGVDVSAIVAAIKDGSISIAAMEEILAAIAEAKGAGGEPAAEQPTEMAEDEPAKYPAPGQEMSLSRQLAYLRGEVEAAKAKLAQRDANDRLRADVAKAMKDLEGRPLGSDIEDKLAKFHRSYGPDAFKAYVDGISKTFAAYTGGTNAAEAFAAQATAVSDVAMKYVAEGTDAVSKAAQFSREWKDLNSRGLVRMSEERYVTVNMQRRK